MNNDLRYYGNPMNWKNVTGDLISRSALKKALNEVFDTVEVMLFDDIIAIIDKAPTVEYPEQITIKCDTEEDKQKLLSVFRSARLEVLVEEERPQGEWIDTGDMNEYWAEEYQCSICGTKNHWHNYCPKCGADMRGGRK